MRKKPKCRLTPFARGLKLAPNPKPLDQSLVARLVLRLDVIEQLPAQRDELEQAAARVIVLHVGLEMFRQIGDPLGQDGNLDFRRACVAGLVGIVLDDRLFALRFSASARRCSRISFIPRPAFFASASASTGCAFCNLSPATNASRSDPAFDLSR